MTSCPLDLYSQILAVSVNGWSSSPPFRSLWSSQGTARVGYGRSLGYGIFHFRGERPFGFAMVPAWLHLVALVSLGAGFLCAAWIAWDELRHPQQMWIMNLVWPVTALFGTVATFWLYLRFGRLATREHMRAAAEAGETPPHKQQTPFPAMVAKGTLHCGAGCTLGDMAAEGLALAFPVVAVGFGWGSLFAEKMFAVWILAYIFAFVLGIAFQYFTIKPMRNLSVREGIVAALKADTLSLTAWQVGMYGFMAIAQFLIFRPIFGVRLEANMVEFWLMMQLAMIAGLLTSYPVNWWLLKVGIKEKM